MKDKQVILLPGNSVSNKAWINEVSESMQSEVAKHVATYDHWESGEAIIDIGKEVDKVAKSIDLNKDTYIFAKSAGCLVALSLTEKTESIKGVVFVGSPPVWAKEKGLEFIVEKLSEVERVLFLQKESDPVIGYADLRDLVESKELVHAETIEYDFADEPKDDHHYANVSYLAGVMDGLLV